MLCKIVQNANTLLELVQFVSDNDVHPTVREEFPDKFMWIDLYILAFLSVSPGILVESLPISLMFNMIASNCVCQLEDNICDSTSAR